MAQDKDENLYSFTQPNFGSKYIPDNNQIIPDTSSDTSDSPDIYDILQSNSDIKLQTEEEHAAKVAKVVKEIKELTAMMEKAVSAKEIKNIFKEITQISNELSYIPAIQYTLSIAAVTFLDNRSKYPVEQDKDNSNTKKADPSETQEISNETITAKVNIIEELIQTDDGLMLINSEIIASRNGNLIDGILAHAIFCQLAMAIIATQEEITRKKFAADMKNKSNLPK